MTEIEAKFVVRRPEQVDAALQVLSAHGFEISECGETSHVDRYFDTDDWSILRAGWACRVRHRNGDDKLTLKSLHGPDGSVFAREEISQPIQGQQDLATLSLPSGPVKDHLRDILNETPVVELFRVTSLRGVYDATRNGEAPLTIELDFDRTRIEAEKTGEKAAGILTFTELELELVSGNAADLEAVACLLHDEAGLMPAQYSKFERGLQAAGLELDTLLRKSNALLIDEDDPVLKLLYEYLAQQLEIIHRQHPRALEGIDPEGVHQLRVATRRLRAIFAAFHDILGEEITAHFNSELRWLARNLGRARDADVIERDAKDSDDTGPRGYERFLEQETICAYEHLIDILHTERYSVLDEELTRFVSAGPPADTQTPFDDLSIATCASTKVQAALQDLLAHGNAIDPTPPAKQLHKLRIETKRFRYLIDFFSIVQVDKWIHLTEAVKKLQDVLGEHQDAVAAQEQLANFAIAIPADDDSLEKLLATARLMQAEKERMTACRRQFAAAWTEFKDVMA
jgi:inorganic triphosphatase YgiF